MKNVLMVAGLCLLTAVLLYSCSGSANDMYAEGKSLILNKETVNDGMKILTKFEKKYPDDRRTPEVILALAMTQQAETMYEDAAVTYERLIKKYPQSPEAFKGMFLMGYMYYEDMKNDDKTREILTTFINTYPDSELVASAKVLIENIGKPVEEWTTVKKINSAGNNPE